MTRALALLLSTLMATGCATQVVPPTAPSSLPPPPSALASPTPSGATPAPSTDLSYWRPLAVYDPNPPGGMPMMDGIAQGELVLTDDCAFVDSVSGERDLVVWPLMPNRWAWDAERREVISMSLRFGSGDQIRLGGGGRAGGSGASIEEIIAETKWIAPPSPECITPRVFFSNGEISEPEITADPIEDMSVPRVASRSLLTPPSSTDLGPDR